MSFLLQYINEIEVVTGLAVLSLSWLFGLPQKIFVFVRTIVKARRLRVISASGMYDAETIKAAVRNYIKPMYASVDPAEYQEPTAALLDARADLFRAMDRFIEKKNTDAKYLFVLADSGMGKTSFLINYFHRAMSSWRRPHGDFLLVSLSSPVALSQITEFELEKCKSINLLLDAFDEDAQAVGRSGERLAEILNKSSAFRTVTISCRTQFFLSEENIPVRTGIQRIGAVPLRESKEHKFAKVYLSPFDENQVKKYLKERYPGIWRTEQRRKALRIVRKVPSLSVRPMLLSHIPEIIKSDRPVLNSVDVYDEMISAWAIRESRWIPPHDLIVLSKELALDFYLNRTKRGGEFAPPKEIVALAKGYGVTGIEENITSRSLLNRTTSGMFKFAHRSIMEYFIADWILNDGGGRGVEVTDQIAKFIAQRLDCSSDAVDVFLTSCSINVEPEPPEHILGHPSNFSIFRELFPSLDHDRLLSVQTVGVDGKKASLFNRLRSFGKVSPYTAEGRLTRVRIVVTPSDSANHLDCAAIVWFGALAICGRFKIWRSELKGLLGSDPIYESEFVISGKGSPGLWDLTNFIWSIDKRSSCVATESNRVGDISAMYNNPSTSFEYSSGENRLLVRVIQGTWDLHGPLGDFGLLSSEAVLEPMVGDFWVVKPITMDVGFGLLRTS